LNRFAQYFLQQGNSKSGSKSVSKPISRTGSPNSNATTTADENQSRENSRGTSRANSRSGENDGNRRTTEDGILRESESGKLNTELGKPEQLEQVNTTFQDEFQGTKYTNAQRVISTGLPHLDNQGRIWVKGVGGSRGSTSADAGNRIIGLGMDGLDETAAARFPWAPWL
jgi:hypothetical protein